MGPTPVVLLHGARASRTMWRAQVSAVERTGRTVRAVDLPGHGARLGERFTVQGCLATIDAVIEELGGRAVLVGLSLGGYVGIAYAARNPRRVAALVAAGCSTVPDQPVTGAWRRAAQLIGRLPDRGAWLNRTLVDRVVPPEGAEALAEGGFALDVMVDLLTEVRTLRPLDDLPRITCPVWLVNGQWDHFRGQEGAYLAACPQARLVVVRGASHLVSLVRPVAFNRVLLSVLEQVDGPDAAGPWVTGRDDSGLAQGPGPDTADDARGVRHDDDVVPEARQDGRADVPGVPAADVQPVPVDDRAQPVDRAAHPA